LAIRFWPWWKFMPSPLSHKSIHLQANILPHHHVVANPRDRSNVAVLGNNKSYASRHMKTLPHYGSVARTEVMIFNRSKASPCC
jgi:hypothetical protein